MSVRTPSPFVDRREFLRSPVGRSPIRDALGKMRAMSFLMSTQADFSPADIASLAHWYDATALTGLNDGDAVATWTDEEGTNDLGQGNASNRPTYETNVLNGNPVLRFDGADYMNVSFTTLTQPNTIYAVITNYTVNGSTPQVILDSETTDTQQLGSLGSGSGEWFAFAGGSAASGTANSITILGGIFDGASSSIREDGSQTGTADVGTDGLNGLTVGADKSDGSNFPGDIAEVLVFDAALGSSDINSVEQYLSDKWGVSI